MAGYNLLPVPGGTVHHIFRGKVYDLNSSGAHNPMLGKLKAGMKKAGLRTFGELPAGCQAKWKAHVTITRILGPRQRRLDEDSNLGMSTKPLVDALVTGGWLVDDNPRWATFVFHQDVSQRQNGPLIDIVITYETAGGTDD